MNAPVLRVDRGQVIPFFEESPVLHDEATGRDYLLMCRGIMATTHTFTDSPENLPIPGSRVAKLMLPRDIHPGQSMVMYRFDETRQCYWMLAHPVDRSLFDQDQELRACGNRGCVVYNQPYITYLGICPECGEPLVNT